MNKLLSEKSCRDETLHIFDDVYRLYIPLRKRAALLVSATVGLSVVSLSLIGCGLTLLLLGQMPDMVSLVEPAMSSNQLIKPAGHTIPSLNDAFGDLARMLEGPITTILASIMMLMGVMQAVLRMNISGFIVSSFGAVAIFTAPQVMLSMLDETATYEQTPYSVIKPQFEIAAESSNWPKAWELLKPIPDTSDEVIVLKAQVAYKAGLEPESVRLIQSIKQGTEFPGQAWFIESAYEENHASAGYQLTEASQAYAENQASRRSQGATMLKGAVPFGALAFLTGCVAFLLRRNAINIQSWLKQKEDQKHD